MTPLVRLHSEPHRQTIRPSTHLWLGSITRPAAFSAYAYEFDLGFSPAQIRADGIAEGPFLAVGGTTFFAPGVIDNGVGTIAFTADTLIGPVPGVAGSGVVATIDFTALTIGTSPLALSNVLLLDSGLGDIAFQASTASVTVTETVIPEPSTALLLACGLIALGTFARRRR
jgi:general secretion pathway protein D